MALSEVIRFVLPSSLTSEFVRLREYISLHGGVRNQYFGNMVPLQSASIPVKENEICWVVQWPHDSDMRTNASFRARLSGLTEGGDAKSLFQFKDTQTSELAKALEAPICEFVIINLSPDAPVSDADFKQSMHKTYTDCYHMQGFVGGHWSYAVNTNDTSGVLAESVRSQWVQEKERRLAGYYLGWESIEHHQTATTTPIFHEELDKLKPWFAPGTGAWYVPLKRHS